MSSTLSRWKAHRFSIAGTVVLLFTVGQVTARGEVGGRPSIPIIQVAEIRAGMKGYGLTVFSGTKPERFDVQVIGVLHHFLPKQDLILIKSDDPRLLHTGVAAGMSGSPIYIEGKLAGALAYGWSFARDPIAGVTPIGSILPELRRPLRGRERVALAMDRGRQQPGSFDDALRERARPALSRLMSYGESGLVEPRDLSRLMPPLLRRADQRLVQAAVPLSVAGMSAGALGALEEALSPYNIVPLQAGGARRPGAPSGPEHFEPGGAIAVELIRGDISAAGTGTVTYIDGHRVAAFGHPMFNVGEVYFPVASAEVVTFMPSLAQSFKMSTPLRTIGTLLQDRQACIVADTSERSDMLPVHVQVTGKGQQDQVFTTEVARHRFLTPLLASSVATSAAQAAASDVSDAVIQVSSRVKLRGFQTLEKTDFVFSPEGLTPKSVLGSSGMKQLSQLLFNPFAPAHIDRLDLSITVDYRADVVDIIGLSLASDELEPGTRPSLYITLRPYNGQSYVQALPFEVPRTAAGQLLTIEACSGNLAKPEMAPPESLSDLVANLRKGYPARSLVITLTTQDEGVTLRGTLVPSLPASVIATLQPGTSTRRAESYKRLNRFVVEMGTVVQGKQELTVQVREERR